jgi:hypothetical protein
LPGADRAVIAPIQICRAAVMMTGAFSPFRNSIWKETAIMKSVIIGACVLGLLVVPALAAPQLCPAGQIAIIRVSTLKPTGTRAGFDKAVKDQIAWYRGHGISGNKIVEAEVIDFVAGAPQMSAREVMTIHYDPPAATGAQPAVDDGYKAFVKEFRDNTDITVEKTVCLPK